MPCHGSPAILHPTLPNSTSAWNPADLVRLADCNMVPVRCPRRNCRTSDLGGWRSPGLSSNRVFLRTRSDGKKTVPIKKASEKPISEYAKKNTISHNSSFSVYHKAYVFLLNGDIFLIENLRTDDNFSVNPQEAKNPLMNYEKRESVL